MRPVSPVIPGYQDKEVIFAKDQPEYLPLPALRLDDPLQPDSLPLDVYQRREGPGLPLGPTCF